MPILFVIMREAERMGLRPEGPNPCRGIRRYRRNGRERFLSDDEIRRLSAVWSQRAESLFVFPSPLDPSRSRSYWAWNSNRSWE